MTMQGMRKCLIITFLSIVISILTSCDKDETLNDIPVNGKVEGIDVKFFEQIKNANDHSASIWQGYEFASYPKYFIYRESEQSNPERGFLINPANEVLHAVKVAGDKSHGLNTFSYNNEIKSANDQLKKGNKMYDFDFKISNGNYYIQAYSNKGINRQGTSDIELSFHEVFHAFQNNWKEYEGGIQDEKNYPINTQLLSLQLMSVEIAKKMPAEMNIDNINKYLSMYIAIRSKEMSIDPSSEKLVTNMANVQENYEGTARYVDYSIAKIIYPDNHDASYVMGSGPTDIKSQEQVRSYFAWGIWYDTGAAVTYMLKKKGANVEFEVKNGKTLYQLANETMKLSDVQKKYYMEKAKEEFVWTEIIKESNRLLNL